MKTQPIDGLTQIALEWARPRVALLDNKHFEVGHLEAHLKNHGYSVHYFTTATEFLTHIERDVFPIQLIDIDLSAGGGDAAGFDVARKSAGLHPDALRICISAVLGNLPISLIVDALNPRQVSDSHLSVPMSLGVRDIWAFYDKMKPGEQLRTMIAGYRNTIGCGDSTAIYMDDALLADFADGFEAIRWNAAGGILEPQVKFVEIVRQLARRPGLPPIDYISLQKLGKGRSKTVVARMTLHFTDSAPSVLLDSPREVRSIIKIGRRSSIDREVANFTIFVPEIFGAAFHPSIEATGICQNLAGVSYSCLSDANRQVAPTLLDALYGNVDGISELDSLSALRRAFDYKLDKSVRPSEESEEGEKLLNAYSRRFGELNAPARGQVHNHSRAAPDLSETLVEANVILERAGLATIADGHKFLRFLSHLLPVSHSVDDLTQQFTRYEGFYEGVNHGDLHLDNILMVPQGTSWTNFYIDFADAGLHHAVLDYVIMEIGLRFQSLKFLSSIYSADCELSLLHTLNSLEEALWTRVDNWLPPVSDLPVPIKEWAAKTFRIGREIRSQADSFLKTSFRAALLHSSECKGGAGFTEKVDEAQIEEAQRHSCGIGLAALSAMHLPQPEHLRHVHIAWFGLVAQVYLSLFNQWRALHLDDQ